MTTCEPQSPGCISQRCFFVDNYKSYTRLAGQQNIACRPSFQDDLKFDQTYVSHVEVFTPRKFNRYQKCWALENTSPWNYGIMLGYLCWIWWEVRISVCFNENVQILGCVWWLFTFYYGHGTVPFGEYVQALLAFLPTYNQIWDSTLYYRQCVLHCSKKRTGHQIARCCQMLWALEQLVYCSPIGVKSLIHKASFGCITCEDFSILLSWDYNSSFWNLQTNQHVNWRLPFLSNLFNSASMPFFSWFWWLWKWKGVGPWKMS